MTNNPYPKFVTYPEREQAEFFVEERYKNNPRYPQIEFAVIQMGNDWVIRGYTPAPKVTLYEFDHHPTELQPWPR